MTVAALFVATGGCYFGLPDVDPWDEKRDARGYAGPHPVVAHPPCSRWCRLAGLVEARWGYKRGDDGGCFAAALAAVRRWGGVLEHPAFSDAWAAFDLPTPPWSGWARGLCGGWVAHVEQCRYGHAAKKATWLYAFGLTEMPALRCQCANHSSRLDTRPRLSRKAAAATPLPFRDLLPDMARSACSDMFKETA